MASGEMKRHYVTFFSPGTFFAERTTVEVPEWNVEAAKAKAEEIIERHNAVPYGFQFTTRVRGPEDFESRESTRSPMYYIHCKVETLKELETRGDEKDRILIENMKRSGVDRAVTTTRGWQWTQPLYPGDVVLS